MLTVTNSSLYPLNGEMIATLLSISDAEANGLFEDAQNYVFVKRLPDGRIALHDEMRRMVNEYVWPEVDPDGDRRRRDSAIAVDYLEQEIQTLTTRITRLQEEEKTAHDAANAQGELNAFVTREPLERELWVLKRQQLVHMLFMDIGKGVKAFTEMFDEATRAYRFYFREALLNEMQRYATQLPPEQMYELKSRQVEFFLDHGSYTQARALATELLQQENLSLEQQVNMLIHRGNGEIRLGNLEKGRRDFDQAVQISQQADLKNWLVRAINARGWAYRNQGDFDLASADYLEAYQLSVQLNDRQQTAWILNNMGLVNAFKGDRDAAFENCQAALRLWEQIGFRRGMGATYSTLGRIYRRFDQLKNALESYSKALDIFESENDIDWINRVTCGKATVLWNLYNELQAIDPANAQKNLDQAEELFNWAFKHGPPNLKPWTLYNLAQIYRARKDFEAARQKFQECRKASREFDEDEREYRSFMRLIHLAWEIGEYNQWQEFAEEYKRLYAERSGGINFALRGTVLRRIADLAICEGKNYDAALNFYKEGLALITHYGIHQPYNYRIGPQLREIDEQLHECVPGNVLSNLGRDLAALWRDNRELITKYPDALLTFQRWEQEGGKA